MLNALADVGQTPDSKKSRVSGKIQSRPDLVMLPLILSLAVLSLLILTGVVLVYLRFRGMERRMASMERDLRQFYRDLGRPKAEIISIKGRPRSG